jgi:hypothetical protein
MLSCISFFDFIPVDCATAEFAKVDDSECKTGGRYAELTVKVDRDTCGPAGPIGLQNF